MLLLIAVFVIAPVQDRAISVAEFIKSFDTESVKHVASKEMGEHIVFVHAPDQPSEEIKTKLAEALSASWRTTETGFKLERTQSQANQLVAAEVAATTKVLKEYQDTLRKKLSEHQTAESRANAALQTLLKHQERFRNTRPSSFNEEINVAADWLIFSILTKLDPNDLASLSLGQALQLASKPIGDQRPMPPGSADLLNTYERDRRELADFSDTIMGAVGEGPLTSWISQRLKGIREPHATERVLVGIERYSQTVFARLLIYNSLGGLSDWAYVGSPTYTNDNRLDVSTSLTAELNEVQRAFVDPVYNYTFIRDPHPAAIDKIMDIEPLSALDPLFRELAKFKSKPLIIVLDDELLEAVDRSTGSIKNISAFIQKAEDFGAISILENADWILLRPSYLLDSEVKRFDRRAIRPFLESTKKAGYVMIEGHISVGAGAPRNYNPLPGNICAYLDRNGYVLVSEIYQNVPTASRVIRDVLKLRGEIPPTQIEVPIASLSSDVRTELLGWARGVQATLQARPGQSPSELELDGIYAMATGLRADSVVRIIPITAGCVGLKDPFPSAYSASELGDICVGFRKPPAEMMAGTYWYGERRGVRMEILLTPKAMLTNEYFESAGEMKEMRGYNSLPEEFRKQVETSYEEKRRLRGGGD
ncbi:MAG: hypothetical protein ABIV13_02715 [Fimbriimonadales bacterium]